MDLALARVLAEVPAHHIEFLTGSNASRRYTGDHRDVVEFGLPNIGARAVRRDDCDFGGLLFGSADVAGLVQSFGFDGVAPLAGHVQVKIRFRRSLGETHLRRSREMDANFSRDGAEILAA